MCVCEHTHGEHSKVYIIFVNSSKQDYKQVLMVIITLGLHGGKDYSRW